MYYETILVLVGFVLWGNIFSRIIEFTSIPADAFSGPTISALLAYRIRIG
jgi:hypothetical protein